MENTFSLEYPLRAPGTKCVLMIVHYGYLPFVLVVSNEQFNDVLRSVVYLGVTFKLISLSSKVTESRFTSRLNRSIMASMNSLENPYIP